MEIWVHLYVHTYKCCLVYLPLASLPLAKIVSEYDQEIPQSHVADNPRAPRKATSSLFPIKMITILERTQLSNIRQNIEQLQTPTMGITINKK